MANIGIFEIPAQGWQNLETIIQEKVPSFAFETNKTYLIQVIGNNNMKICEKSETPEADEGFRTNKEIFSYTYGGATCFVNAYLMPTYLNIAE